MPSALASVARCHLVVCSAHSAGAERPSPPRPTAARGSCGPPSRWACLDLYCRCLALLPLSRWKQHQGRRGRDHSRVARRSALRDLFPKASSELGKLPISCRAPSVVLTAHASLLGVLNLQQACYSLWFSSLSAAAGFCRSLMYAPAALPLSPRGDLVADVVTSLTPQSVVATLLKAGPFVLSSQYHARGWRGTSPGGQLWMRCVYAYTNTLFSTLVALRPGPCSQTLRTAPSTSHRTPLSTPCPLHPTAST